MIEFSLYLCNLGRYAEGKISADWLKLPTSTEQVQTCLRAIGVDGKRYEETIILEYETNIPDLANQLNEYCHLDELNYLVNLLHEMEEDDVKFFTALVQYGEYSGNLQDLINLTQNLDCYTLLPNVKTAEDYGFHLVDVEQRVHLSREIAMYFNYESYGECTAINNGGDFTEQGFVCNNQTEFISHYNGTDVPDKYKVFAYPTDEHPHKGVIFNPISGKEQTTRTVKPVHRDKKQSRHGR